MHWCRRVPWKSHNPCARRKVALEKNGRSAVMRLAHRAPAGCRSPPAHNEGTSSSLRGAIEEREIVGRVAHPGSGRGSRRRRRCGWRIWRGRCGRLLGNGVKDARDGVGHGCARTACVRGVGGDNLRRGGVRWAYLCQAHVHVQRTPRDCGKPRVHAAWPQAQRQRARLALTHVRLVPQPREKLIVRPPLLG